VESTTPDGRSQGQELFLALYTERGLEFGHAGVEVAVGAKGNPPGPVQVCRIIFSWEELMRTSNELNKAEAVLGAERNDIFEEAVR
jgi:hypothetical protein